MASFTWNGSTGDGNHDTNANWVGGTAPTGAGSPHDITFDRGAYDMTTNIAVAYAMSSLTITAGFTGSIGSDTASYTATGAITVLKCNGRGKRYKIGASTTVGSTLANRSQISLPQNTEFFAASGTWAYGIVQGGIFTASDTAVLTTMWVMRGTRAYLYSNATAVTLMWVDTNSSVVTSRTLTEVHGNTGSYTETRDAAAITTGRFFSGSTLAFKNGSAATHTTLELHDGARQTLDGAMANQTVTNLYYLGADIQKYAGGVTLTVTNEYPLFFGGAVSVPR